MSGERIPSIDAAAPVRFVDPPWRFHWLVGLGFAAMCFAVSYPGRLNADTLFTVVTTGTANNWHSATLGWFWRLPAGWLGQPGGALAMQAALFGSFAGFLPDLPPTPRGRAALAGEWLIRIVLAGGAGYVGKDAMIVLLLLIAVQLVRGAIRGRPTAATIVALTVVAALFLLTKAPNFLVIVVALALILPFLSVSRRRYVAIVAAAAVVGSLAVPLNRTVDRVVFAARDLHPDKQLVLFDLAGISVRTGTNAFAGIPGWPTAQLPTPASCFLPYMWDAFAEWAPCGGYATAYDRLDGALKRRWLATIATHPIAYVRHRLTYTGYLLRSEDHATWGIAGQSVNDTTDPAATAEMARAEVALRIRHPVDSWHPSIATAPMRWLETTLFRFPMVQWAGLLGCLAVLVGSWLRRRDGVRFGAILAAALGTGNLVTLAVFGVADPARYMWPTVALAYIAMLALIAPTDRTPADNMPTDRAPVDA